MNVLTVREGVVSRFILMKNLFDLRPTAVVHNLHVLLRLFQDDPELPALKADIASIVTIQPLRSNTFNSSGIAVISLDLSSTFHRSPLE